MTRTPTTNALAHAAQPRSIIVTGGTGFVGRQVVRQLLSQGFRIILVSRSSSDLGDFGGRMQAIRTTTDLFSEAPERLAELVAGADTLIHCAWCTDRLDYQSTTINIECLEGTVRLARAFARGGGTRFVGMGTCAEYDHTGGILPVTTPLRPSSLYGACKAAAFIVLDSLLPSLGVAFTWCRLFYLFGEGERPDRLLPTVRRHLEDGVAVSLTDGGQVRDFLDVKDAGRMVAQAVAEGLVGPLNICSEIGTTVRALVESVADEYGRRDLLQFGSRSPNPFDPPCIIGRRSGRPATDG